VKEQSKESHGEEEVNLHDDRGLVEMSVLPVTQLVAHHARHLHVGQAPAHLIGLDLTGVLSLVQQQGVKDHNPLETAAPVKVGITILHCPRLDNEYTIHREANHIADTLHLRIEGSALRQNNLSSNARNTAVGQKEDQQQGKDGPEEPEPQEEVVADELYAHHNGRRQRDQDELAQNNGEETNAAVEVPRKFSRHPVAQLQQALVVDQHRQEPQTDVDG